jgi:hypothetical protein
VRNTHFPLSIKFLCTRNHVKLRFISSQQLITQEARAPGSFAQGETHALAAAAGIALATPPRGCKKTKSMQLTSRRRQRAPRIMSMSERNRRVHNPAWQTAYLAGEHTYFTLAVTWTPATGIFALVGAAVTLCVFSTRVWRNLIYGGVRRGLSRLHVKNPCLIGCKTASCFHSIFKRKLVV